MIHAIASIAFGTVGSYFYGKLCEAIFRRLWEPNYPALKCRVFGVSPEFLDIEDTPNNVPFALYVTCELIGVAISDGLSLFAYYR